MANKSPFAVLTKRGDFLSLSKNGKRVRMGGWLVLNYLPNGIEITRCGWTLPKKVGNAVVRNRLKRWCRVYLRDSLAESPTVGVDVNVVFLKTDGDFYKKLDYEEFSKQMDKAWALLRKRL